jgi:hypothetical protein
MSKSRDRLRKEFAAQAAKIRRDREAAIQELRSTQGRGEISKQQGEKVLKEINFQAEQDMTDLRVNYEEAGKNELNVIKQRLYGMDDSERMSTVQQMAWRDAVIKASGASDESDARIQFVAATLAGDKMWQRALAMVGETRPWGPAIHEAWADVDEDAAALMGEYDELEAELGDRATRLADSAGMSLRGEPQLDGEGGGAPQLVEG